MKKKFYGIVGSLMLLIACLFAVGVYSSVTQRHDTTGDISYDPAVQESYLLKSWQTKLTNTGVDLTTLTSITFTQQKQDIPVGTTPISIGASDKTGTKQFDQNSNCYDISAYIKDTSLVFYSSKPIFAPVDSSYLFSHMPINTELGNISNISLKNFDTSNAIRMYRMFDMNEQLTSLDVSKFDTRNVLDMQYMFYGCRKLTSLDVSNFDTSKVTDMSNMFESCRALTSLDLSNFDTTNVTDMSWMFSGCSALTSLDLSNFDTSKVPDMTCMFSWCLGLTSLDLSNFDTSKVTNMQSMFSDCSALTSLDISNFDMTNVTNVTTMFDGCSVLKTIQTPKNVGVAIDLPASNFYKTTDLTTALSQIPVGDASMTLKVGYAITANANNGTIATTTGWTGSGDTATKVVLWDNNAVGALPSISRSGFGFGGWYTATSGGTKVDTTTTISANTTIYARWNANAYTINYVLNNGTNASGNPTSFTYSASAQTKTINNPTRTGYTFAGWTVDGGTISGTTLTITAGRTSDVTLTANWTIKTFTVTIATNNSAYGTVDKTSIANVPYGTAITVDSNKLTINGTTVTATAKTITGYTTKFASWANASGTITAARTITANFTSTINSYTLTANANNGTIATTTGWTGTGATATKSVQYNAAYGTLPTVSRTGYTLKGWYTAATNGTQITTETKMAASATTIYAQWTANAYTINYVLNNGTNASGNPTSFTYSASAQTKTVNNPTRTGYDFAGWTVDGGTISGTTLTITAGRTSDVTLTASWTANKYTITYKDQGDVSFSGTHASGYPTQHTYGTATTLKTASKTGYTFGGWFTTSACTGSAITSLGATAYTSNITLYAKWTINSYNYTVTVPMTGTAQTVTITANGTSKTVTSNNGTATFSIPYGTSFTPRVNVSYTSGRYNIVWGSTATALRVASGVNVQRGSALTMGTSGLSDTVKLTQLYFATAKLSANVGTAGTYTVGTTNNPTTELTSSQEYYFLSNANVTLYAKTTYTSGAYNSTFGSAAATKVASGTVVNSGAFAPTYAGVTKTLTVSQLYTLQAKASGNGTVTPASATYVLRNGSIAITATPTSASGYSTTFSSWAKTSGTCTIASTSTANTTVSAITADSVVTAIFARTANKYTITYKDKDNLAFSGTHESGYPTQHTYGTATTLKGATKTGYTFGGWYTNSTCVGVAVTSLGATDFTSNITLYALWTQNVSYFANSTLLADTLTAQSIDSTTITSIKFTKSSSDIPSSPTKTFSIGASDNTGTKAYTSSANCADITAYLTGTSLVIYSPYTIFAPTECDMLFENYSGLTNLVFGNFDTSKVTNMSSMFYNDSKLTSLDLSNFDTSSVEDMSGMFYYCSNLTNLNVNNFDTNNVIDMSHMFVGCSGLTSLDLSSFDTSNVTIMSGMFYGCSKLTSLDLSSFDTSNVMQMPGMFSDCSALKTIQTPKNVGVAIDLPASNFYKPTDLTTALSQIPVGNASITLKVGYTITANANGNGTIVTTTGWNGSGDTATKVVLWDNNVVGTLPTVEAYMGSTFKGWYTASSGGTKVTETTIMGSSNATIYAQYEAATYKITYKDQGGGAFSGTHESGYPTEFTYGTEIELKGATKTGYTFGGWYYQSDCSGSVQTIVDRYTEGDIILYAKWTQNVSYFVNHTLLADTLTAQSIDSTTITSIKFTKSSSYIPSSPTKTFSIGASDDTGATAYTSSANCADITAYLTGTSLVIYSPCTIFAPVDSNNLFGSFGKLTSITFDNFDTSNVTNMSLMFQYCEVLTSLNISGFVTANVTDMSYMFHGCAALTDLNVSSFNTANVTNMSGMFANCEVLTSLDVSKFDTSYVTNMWGMFAGCEALTSLNISGFVTANVTNMSLMFAGCAALTSLNVSSFNTANVTDMADMFECCAALTSLNVSSFNTVNVTNMSLMFAGCEALTDLNVSSFNTANVTNMSGMFASCTALTSLNVSDFVTGRVTDMADMFSGCAALTSLDLSSFDTSKVTDMSYMFSKCSGLISLDLSSFNTANVTDMADMFESCTALTSLNVSDFVTGRVTDMSGMFRECSGLTSLDLSSFDMTEVTNVLDVVDMFAGCHALKTINTPTNVKVAIDLPASNFYKTTDLTTALSQIPVGDASLTLKVGYTITANANSGGTITTTTGWTGSGDTATKVVLWDNNVVGALPTVEAYMGSTFKGWYTASSGGTKVTETTIMGSSNATIYAQYEAATYKITYKDQGGGAFSGTHESGYPTDYTFGIEVELKGATKTGYTFGGWYYQSDCSGSVQTIVDRYTEGDITLYAKWTANTYTITANANGGTIATTTGWTGTGESATKTLTFGSTYGTLPTCNISETGLTFDGWYTEATGGTKVDASTVMSNSDVTIYAHYTTVTYQIYVYNDINGTTTNHDWSVLDVNGKYVGYRESGIISYGETICLPSGITGIIGWQVAKQDSNFEYSLATWGKSENDIIRKFTRYNAEQGMIDCSYSDEIFIKNLSSTVGATLSIYPVFEITNKTITFDVYFNNTSSSDGIVGLDEAVWSAFTNFANITVNGVRQMDGYLTDTNSFHTTMPANGTTVFSIGNLFDNSQGTLIGWIRTYFTGSNFNCSSARLFINQGNGDVEITSTTADIRILKNAQIILRCYESTVYSLICDTNGGILVGDTVISPWGASDDYSANAQLMENTVIGEMPTATRTGYDFAGWYTTKDSGGTQVTKYTQMFSANTTLYARWTLKQYAINYTLYNGTIADGNPTTYTYSTTAQTITIPNAPTRSGYALVRWVVLGGTSNGTLSKVDGNYVLNIPARKTGTITLVAQWAKKYTVYFMFQFDTGEEVLNIEHTDPNGYIFEGQEYLYDMAYLYEGATGLPTCTLEGYKFLGYFSYGSESCPSPNYVDLIAEYQFPIDEPLKLPSDFCDWMYLYPVFERIDGYLSKNWKNSITNMSSVQSILFTSDSSKIPSGVTPVSVGAKQNGTDAWTSDCDTLDVKLYQSGTSLVVYCAGNLCIVDAQNMFNGTGFSSLTSLTLDNIDTSRVTTMYDMFYGCSNLKTLNLNKFDTSNVTNMSGMFYNCSSLTTLNVTSFDTSKVTIMQGMFASCSSLTTLDVANFNTSKVYFMTSMFRGMSKLSSLYLSNFDTSEVTDFSMMFYECSNLSELSLSKFVTTSATSMNSMFYYCSSLTSLNLSSFDTSKVTSMYAMFSGCSKLKTLNISNFEISSSCNVTGMLTNCSSLTTINSPKINNKAIELPKTFYLNNTAVTQIAVNTSGTSKVYSSTKN